MRELEQKSLRSFQEIDDYVKTGEEFGEAKADF